MQPHFPEVTRFTSIVKYDYLNQCYNYYYILDQQHNIVCHVEQNII